MRKGQDCDYDKRNIYVIVCDAYIRNVMTSTSPRGTLGSVSSLLAATLYQGNPDRTTSSGISYQLRDIYSIYAGAAGMLLCINGKSTMGKLKTSPLS